MTCASTLAIGSRCSLSVVVICSTCLLRMLVAKAKWASPAKTPVAKGLGNNSFQPSWSFVAKALATAPWRVPKMLPSPPAPNPIPIAAAPPEMCATSSHAIRPVNCVSWAEARLQQMSETRLEQTSDNTSDMLQSWLMHLLEQCGRESANRRVVFPHAQAWRLPRGYIWSDWNTPEALAEEAELAELHCIGDHFRGPVPPHEGGPETWRSMPWDYEHGYWRHRHRESLPAEYAFEDWWDEESLKQESLLARWFMIPWDLRGPPTGPAPNKSRTWRGRVWRCGRWMLTQPNLIYLNMSRGIKLGMVKNIKYGKVKGIKVDMRDLPPPYIRTQRLMINGSLKRGRRQHGSSYTIEL